MSSGRPNSEFCDTLGPKFKLLGRFNKYGRYPRHLRANSYVIDKLASRNYFPTNKAYGYALGNYEASFKGVAKYSHPQPDYDVAAFDKATKMLFEAYSCIRDARFMRDTVHRMEMSSSPGYPWTLVYRTKRDAIQDHELMSYIRRCEQYGCKNSIWSNACKREPKKFSKLANNDIRVITGAPMEQLANAIYLFADMNEKIYERACANRISSTVGTTKFCRGFHKLYMHLNNGGEFPYALELDYTNFDGTCDKKMFEIVSNLRYNMYHHTLQNQETKQRLIDYYSDVVHSKIIMENGDLIQKETGNPSGQFNTIIDNCFINEWRWYYAWCLITPEEFHNYASFRRFCVLRVCGDDSIISGNSATRTLFPAVKILQVFSAHGWKPKLSRDDWIPLHQAQFCSLNFAWFQGCVVPVPANYDKLIASLVWGGKHKGMRELLSRLLGIRMDCMFLPRFRSFLEEMIDEIFDLYHYELNETPLNPDDLTYFELRSVYKSTSELLDLYLGDENGNFVPGRELEFSNSHLNDFNEE